MLSAWALRNESNVAGAGTAPTRADIIDRYRHLRAISKQHHTGAYGFVSSSALLQQARRLGMSDGRGLILDSAEEFDMVSDLIIYGAPPGRSRALDRYARSTQHPAGSDEAIMLEAMREARFGVLRMQRRHPAAGLILRDEVRGDEIWLVDLGYETWMTEGMRVATRYCTPGPFAMTVGVVIPLHGPLIAQAMHSVPQLLRKKPAQLCDDPRFAEALYRTAIEGGVMERVRYVDPPAEGYAA